MYKSPQGEIVFWVEIEIEMEILNNKTKSKLKIIV